MVDNFKYFSINEFKCPCCNNVDISIELIMKLDKARELAGIPFKITSGYRCERHNKEIGGKKHSSHLKGLAVDISALSSKDKFKIVSALLEVGFKRLGIGDSFIHADIDDEKPQNVIWTY